MQVASFWALYHCDNPKGRCDYAHLTSEGTEGQRSLNICLRSHKLYGSWDWFQTSDSFHNPRDSKKHCEFWMKSMLTKKLWYCYFNNRILSIIEEYPCIAGNLFFRPLPWLRENMDYELGNVDLISDSQLIILMAKTNRWIVWGFVSSTGKGWPSDVVSSVNLTRSGKEPL